MNIIDIGVVPTPLVYFTVFHLDLQGAVQITGSHNPPKDNGFKMMRGKDSLFGTDIQTLRMMMINRDFDLKEKGSYQEKDILPAYEGFVKGNLHFERDNIRFAIDAGNGAGGPAALAAMRACGLNPIALLCDMDGQFPVHHPDPTEPHNLELLIQTVKENNLDLGIAFDGDADRIGVVDANGDILWGDKLLTLLARAILEKVPGSMIIGDVKCSQTLYDDIENHGGTPLLWKTGHSLIKTKLKETGAPLAGEMSGHIFYSNRFFGYDDAIYVALRLLEIIAASKKPLHHLLDDLPKTFVTPEIRVESSEETKFIIVNKVLEHYQKTHKVIDIDGARILFDGGWGLVRASNTQAVIVMRFEANSPERLQEIRQDVEQIVNHVQLK